MAEIWLLLQSGSGAAAENMAMDEALMEQGASRRPVLRFYGWLEPAATFGYFQRHGEIERLTPLRPLVRRPTGGGLVPHDADWTYSVAIPPAHPWYGLRAVESYRRLHEWLRAAFSLLQTSTTLARAPQREGLGQCFIGAEQFDLLWQGRKIAGAAQRRSRHGLLIQGSVQPGRLPVAKADWQKAMCDAAVHQWGVEWHAMEWDARLQERTDTLAREKYSRTEYNSRR